MGERIFTREDAKSLIRSNSDKVKLPSDFTGIATGALAGFSQMKELTIPEGIRKIASHAFFTRSFRNTSSLEKLTIPSSLKEFDRWCFYDCNALKTINLPADFPEEKAMELFFHCPSATLNFGKKLLFAARSKTVQQVMDETSGILSQGAGTMLTVDKDGTLKIPSSYIAILPHGLRGLASKGIKRIMIPSGMRIISANAFSFLDTLEEVILETGVTAIDNGAFAGCKRLRSIQIPETVEAIGAGAFMNLPNLERIRLPQNLTELSDDLFSGDTKLKKIVMGYKIERVGAGVFNGCTALQSLMLPDSVKMVGTSAFWECTALQRLYIPEGCKSLSQSSLANCPSLQTLYLPRIIHDENEKKRVFGDVTNPTVTWLDGISSKPVWSDDDLLPDITEQIAVPVVPEVPVVPQKPVLPSDVPIQAAFRTPVVPAPAPMPEQPAPVPAPAPAASKPEPVSAPEQNPVDSETVRRLEQTISAMQQQMAEMSAQQQAAAPAPAPQPELDAEAIASLQKSLAEAQSVQASAAELQSIRQKVEAMDEVKSRMDQLAANQETVQAKVDALSDVQSKVDEISKMQEKVDALSSVQDKVEALSDVEEKISVIPELQQKVEEMSDLHEKVSAISETAETIGTIQDMANAISDIQEKVDTIADVQEKIEAIPEMQEKVEAISELQEKISVIPEIQQTVAEISERQEQVESAVQSSAADAEKAPLNPVKEAYAHAAKSSEKAQKYGELDQSISFVPVRHGEYRENDKVFTHEISKPMPGPVERSTALKEYTVIASRAFLGSEGGERFEIPEGIRRVETQAFWDCPRLLALELPKSLEEVEPDAFSGCSHLTDVYLCEGFPDRKAVEYFLFRPEIKLHWPKKSILSRARVATVAELMENYDEILTAQKAKALTVQNHILEVPEGYTILAPYFAQALNLRTEEPEHVLKTISLPQSLRRICSRAFSGLETVVHIVLPEGLQIVDMNAFSGCLGPHRLVLPDSVSYLGPFAFAAPCQYEQIRLPNTLKEIPANLFSNCNTLVTLRIPDSVETIGDLALSGCTALTNLTVPKRFAEQLPAILDGPVKINVTYNEDTDSKYEENAPDPLLSVIAPKFAPAAEQRIFTAEISAQCENFAERLKAMHSHPIIGSYALEDMANQTKFEIPLGVMRLCSYAFGDNNRLMTLIIPKALTEFEYAAFYHCQKLRDVFLPDEFDRNMAAVLFMYQPSILVSFGNSRSVRIRQLMLECPWMLSAGNSSDLSIDEETGTLRIPDGYLVIGSYMYHGVMRRQELRRIAVPGSVKLVGSNAISNIRNLEEVEFAPGLKALEPEAITSCPSLKRVILPHTLEFLGVSPFIDCPALEKLVLPVRFADREEEIVRACPKVKIEWLDEVPVEETEPVVEDIAPVEKAAPIEETEQVVEEISPVEEAETIEETEPLTEEIAPVIEETEPVPEEIAPIEKTEPVIEETAPVEEDATIEEAEPVEETELVEESKPVLEDIAPIEGSEQVVEETEPVEETELVEESKPVLE
ncbi:MAG: leucine-rich repeat protein, partial [Oscillospiraceae bacterium]|nr:leucine-rich repeat protein [Oscillospiraceae bacterium]